MPRIYEERKDCLKYAFEQGFRTSVSMEPMLDRPHVEQLIDNLRPFVNVDIWLGTMNHLEIIKKWADEKLMTEIAKIEAGQSPESLTALFNTFKDDSLVKWKTDALEVIKTAQKQAADK